MNDIEILREMLISDAQVPLRQQQGGFPSVELTDRQANTTVEIKGLPHDSIVVRAEDFEDPLTIFKGSKGERKRADFLIVSNGVQGKWIICIETQAGNYKRRREVIEQLKGALCFVHYCKCIGKEFWEWEEFLDGYQYRFISMVDINSSKETKRTRHYSLHMQPTGGLHDTPDAFLKFLRSPMLHFSHLLHEVS